MAAWFSPSPSSALSPRYSRVWRRAPGGLTGIARYRDAEGFEHYVPVLASTVGYRLRIAYPPDKPSEGVEADLRTDLMCVAIGMTVMLAGVMLSLFA